MFPGEAPTHSPTQRPTDRGTRCPTCGYSAAGIHADTCPECGGPLGRRERDELRAFLVSRDHPCPACAYSLRDLQSDICPECGERLELRVGMVEPRMRLWIAGLVGLAAGAGFNALLLVYVVIMVTVVKRGGLPGGFYIINSAGLVVESLAMTWWLLKRRQFRNRPVPIRALLAALAWALALLNVTVFSLTIR